MHQQIEQVPANDPHQEVPKKTLYHPPCSSCAVLKKKMDRDFAIAVPAKIPRLSVYHDLPVRSRNTQYACCVIPKVFVLLDECGRARDDFAEYQIKSWSTLVYGKREPPTLLGRSSSVC